MAADLQASIDVITSLYSAHLEGLPAPLTNLPQHSFHQTDKHCLLLQAFWRKFLAAVAGACSIVCVALLLNIRWLLNRMQTMKLAMVRLQNQ